MSNSNNSPANDPFKEFDSEDLAYLRRRKLIECATAIALGGITGGVVTGSAILAGDYLDRDSDTKNGNSALQTNDPRTPTTIDEVIKKAQSSGRPQDAILERGAAKSLNRTPAADDKTPSR